MKVPERPAQIRISFSALKFRRAVRELTLGRAIDVLKFAPQIAVAGVFISSCIEKRPALELIPFFVPFHRALQYFASLKDPKITSNDISSFKPNIRPFKKNGMGVAGFVLNGEVLVLEDRLASGKLRGLLEHEKAHLLGASEALAWMIGFKAFSQTKLSELKELGLAQVQSALYFVFPTFTYNVLGLFYGVMGRSNGFNHANLYEPEPFSSFVVPGKPLTEYQSRIIDESEHGGFKPNLYQLGIIFMWKGDLEWAKTCLGLCDKLNGGTFYSHLALGNLLLHMNEKADAAKSYAKAVSLCDDRDPWKAVLQERIGQLNADQ